MKKKILLVLAIAAAGVFILTACTSSDQATSGNSATNNSATNNSATNNATINDSATNNSATNQTTVNDTATDQTNAGNTINDNDTANTPAEDTQDEIFAPEQGEPGYDGEPDGEIIPDDEVLDEMTSADSWSGSYEASAESVSVQLQTDGNIFFTFAQSGISGVAEVNGTQAIFHGDDYHVVVFNLNGDTLEISVSSEEDFDASASPLNGSYKKIG